MFGFLYVLLGFRVLQEWFGVYFVSFCCFLVHSLQINSGGIAGKKRFGTGCPGINRWSFVFWVCWVCRDFCLLVMRVCATGVWMLHCNSRVLWDALLVNKHVYARPWGWLLVSSRQFTYLSYIIPRTSSTPQWKPISVATENGRYKDYRWLRIYSSYSSSIIVENGHVSCTACMMCTRLRFVILRYHMVRSIFIGAFFALTIIIIVEVPGIWYCTWYDGCRQHIIAIMVWQWCTTVN